MKAAVVMSPGILAVKDVPEPNMGPYQALVKIIACATCNSTDKKLINGSLAKDFAKFPAILGHESIGRVIEIGDRVRNYKIGDLVIRPAAVYPGERLGQYYSAFGGIAEKGLATDYKADLEDNKKVETDFTLWHLYQQVIPHDFNPIDSTILITFREVLDWSHRFGIGKGHSLVILGSGPVAMVFASVARILGASPIIMVGLRDERLKLALKLGIDHVINSSVEDLKKKVMEYSGGSGACHVVEAVGDSKLLNTSFDLISHNGKIGIYGAGPSSFNIDWSKAPATWTITQILQDERDSHDEVIGLVRAGKIDLKDYYSHILELDEINMAFELLKKRKALKIVIRIS